MRWTSLHKIAVSLPLAVLAALSLVAINEAGFYRSHAALEHLAHSQSTHASVNRLLQSMLDAETGHRGYLLTGDDRYLEPYEGAVTSVHSNLEQLRMLMTDSAEDLADFSLLSGQISRKLSEMELSLHLRRKGQEDAWKFVMSTDVGKENMDAIRQHSRALIERSNLRVGSRQADIRQSLVLSRMGIALVRAIGLLAFYMYLRQTRALQHATEREQEVLELERARLEDLVRERTASLTALANHLQQVREDERGHLARELHDELGALLTAAKLDVARLKSRIDANAPEVAERLKHLTETLNSGIALKRRIIEDLRPSSLSNLGLTAAIEILTREYAERAGIEVETSLESVQLPDASQLTVYRMVQEALTNIGKYAKASKVLVSVHGYPTHVAVQVRDDGEGFDPATVRPTSHGLSGMRHRVESAGGRLSITSRPGNGTLVSAVLPLQRHGAEASSQPPSLAA